jgi:hypothetical protein
LWWARAAISTGIAFVVAVFLYYVAAPWNFIGGNDPVGGEAGYAPVMKRVEAELQKTGASWIATTDYRTYAMLRWFLADRVPVIQINERGRYLGFREPDMNLIRDHTGLYVAPEPYDHPGYPIWASVPAKREPLERVDRIWRGTVMDTYAIQKLTGWTPELSPPPNSPLFQWRALAGEVGPRMPIADGRSFRDAAQAGKPDWIASRSLSSGAHSRDPLARNDGVIARSVSDEAIQPRHSPISRSRSLLRFALAQQILGEIAERGPRQRGEGQRAGHIDRRQSKPRRQQPVENAFAQPLRQFCGKPMAEHLLDQAVACGHAAGNRDMGDHVAP